MASDWSIEIDGVFEDFSDDLGFLVTESLGTGVAKTFNLLSPMATQPGGISEGQSLPSRSFRVLGSIIAEGGEDKTDVHDKRQALAKAINSYRSSVSSELPTRRLRYSGATVTKDIYALFDGGLDDEPPVGWAEEDLAIRFLAPDPLFYATSETTTTLDSLDTNSAVYGWFGRVGGQWSNLDSPSGSGTYTAVQAIVADDTYIYVGGEFTNFDNIASADYIVRYNKSTGAYSALSSGLNGAVFALAIDSNGDLILGGSFTNAGGVGAADYIARWNGSAFSAIGTPNSGASITTIDSIEIAPNGDIYFGGNFTNLAGIANADYIGYWDLSGSSYSALGTGANNSIQDIAIDGQSNVYTTGQFTTIGGTSVNHIAMWNGSAWLALGDGLESGSNYGFALAIGSDGTVYVGGDFATAGGVTVNGIAAWNGTSFSALGAGADAAIIDIKEADNGDIVVAGAFDEIGALTNILSRIAAWNGSSWTYPDINVSGNWTNSALYLDGDDIYAGGFTGASFPVTITYAGQTTIEYNGTAVAYAKITINRSGGTTATIWSIVNHETGARLFVNYDLLDGETLTFEGRPQEGISVTSSMFGAVPNAVLPGSNLSQFYLTPGNGSGNNDNEIYTYVDTTGSPTITANIIYKSAYISLD